MAIAVQHAERPEESAARSDAYVAGLGRLMRLVLATAELRSVRRVGLAGDERCVAVWVIQSDESLDEEERVYELARECFASDGRPEIDVHVTSLARVAERNLPPMIAVFER